MPGAVTIKLTTNKFPALAARLPQVVGDICETSAKAIEADAKTSMAQPKHGRIYDVGGVAPHQASAPGESPAIDTGLLANIQTEADGRPTRWVTYTTAEYAAALEFGSPTLGIAPRPFFTPAAERERPHFIRALRDLESGLA